MSSLKLIAVYAGYGDTLLLQTPDTPPKYWLIDGGPVSPFPSQPLSDYKLCAYYQFLQRALLRFCKNPNGIIELSGIIVSHPHKDHVDGLIRLIENWLPDVNNLPSTARPLDLQGPVIMNATCFKRPTLAPESLYKGEDWHLDFARLLAKKDFAPSLIARNIANPMMNTSLVDCYEMIKQGPGQGSYKLPLSQKDRAGEVKGLDPCSINRRSILTMWTEPPGQQLRLVSTGDAMAFDILPMMEEVEKNPKLGIFKVPHHGSRFNSQSKENPITDTMVNIEKDHIFLLGMLVQEYFQPNPPNPIPSLQTIRDDNLGEPRDEWMAASHAKSFTDVLVDASTFTCQYLGGHKYRVDLPTGTTIDLSTADGRREFAVKLAEREERKKAAILCSPTGHVTAVEQNLIELMKSSDIMIGGTPKRSKTEKGFKLEGDASSLLGQLEPDRSKSFLVLRNALFADEINSLYLTKFIANFYRSFTATNYIISANGEHDHPNASTIAGIMAACLVDSNGSMKPKPASPARLFVTSGYSVQLDRVRNIVKLLVGAATLSPTPPPPPTWADWIQLLCLEKDYLMSIPLNNDPVSGCINIEFPPGNDRPQETELTLLHEQFQLSQAYDMPRAAVSAHSTFQLSIEDPNGGLIGYLSINANNTLELTNNQSLFKIVHTDYWPRINTPGPPPLNPKPTFKLEYSNYTLPNEIMFSTTGHSISTVPAGHLCYDPAHNPPLWFDSNAPPARVVTKRMDELH